MIEPYEKLYEAEKRKREREFEEALRKEETRYGAKGESGRALAETKADLMNQFLERMGLFRGKLGIMGEQTEEARRVAATAFGRRKELTFAEWAEMEKRQSREFEHQKEMQVLQQNWQAKQASEERHRQRKQAIYGTLGSMLYGGALGMAFPTAMGVGKEATGFSKYAGGFGRGFACGAPTASYLAGSQPRYEQQQSFMEKMYAKSGILPGTPSTPAGETPTEKYLREFEEERKKKFYEDIFTSETWG